MAGKLSVRLRNRTDKPNSSYDKVFEVTAEKGKRCEFEFMTGYAGYGYAISPFYLEVTDASSNAVTAADVLVEKMRPSRKASVFGKGIYLDAVSPVSEGEWLVTEGEVTESSSNRQVVIVNRGEFINER